MGEKEDEQDSAHVQDLYHKWKKQQVSKTPGIKELQKLYLAFGYLLYEMSAQISLRENGSCEVFKAN